MGQQFSSASIPKSPGFTWLTVMREAMTKAYFISSRRQLSFEMMKKQKPGALEGLPKAVCGTAGGQASNPRESALGHSV